MTTYTIARDNLSIEAMAEAILMIKEHEELEIDDLCHIVIKETNTKIGYLGDESIQFCDYPNNLMSKEHRKYHDYIVDVVFPAVDDLSDNYNLFLMTE